MTATPAYPPPPANAPPAQQGPKISATWTGILLALGGLVAAIGSFLDYEKLSGNGATYSFTGVGSESVTGGQSADAFEPANAGKIILVVGIIALVLGLLIAARRGRIWVSIVALVASAIGVILSLAALAAPSSDAKDIGQGVTGSVEIGAILGIAGTAVALIASIIALIARRRAA